MAFPLLKLWPFEGYRNSSARQDVSPQEMTGPSLDWLVPDKKLRRRAGSDILGDTWPDGLKQTLYCASGRVATVTVTSGAFTETNINTTAGTHDDSDATLDGAQAAGDLVNVGAGIYRVEYALDAFTVGGTISFVRVIMRARTTGTGISLDELAPSINGTTRGTAQSPTASYASYQWDFTTDPADSQPWTIAKLAAQKFGLWYDLRTTTNATTAAGSVPELKVEVHGPMGPEVTGILPAKWGALCRRLIAAKLRSLSDGYRTLVGLVTEEATAKAGQLFFRNTNGTDSWRTVGAEWSTTHYPAAPTAQPNLSVVPFVYENQWGGVTLTRLKTELERRYLCAGSRDVRAFGDDICWPGYTGTPMRWNGRFNTATDSGSEKCEVFPLGLIPPLQVPTPITGTDLGTSTVGPWKGDDAFFHTLVFENERGEWSMWPIPRPPNSVAVGYVGFGYFKVGTTLHYYDRVTLINVACGPPGTRKRHIMRTTKVDTAATSGAVFPPLTSLGICATIENNSETSVVLDDANDLSLNFDPRIIEMVERGLQWPPRAQLMGRFDGHATIGKLRPNPAALILAPWNNGTINAPITCTSTSAYTIYGTTSYFVRVSPTSITLRSMTGTNETDLVYPPAGTSTTMAAYTLRMLVDQVLNNSTTTTVSHTCSTFLYVASTWVAYTVLRTTPVVADVEVGMHVVHASIPEDCVVTFVHDSGGYTYFDLSKQPTAAITDGAVSFWKAVANTTTPSLWGIGLVPGADGSQSCNELLRTYVNELSTFANGSTTVTLAATTNALHIMPGMFVMDALGTAFTSGTLVTAVNTTTGAITVSAATLRVNGGASEAVIFYYDTGDTTAATSSDQNGYGFVRAFGNALPAVLYWRKSYLDGFEAQVYASQFSAASPGRPQDAINTWFRKNRHDGPAEFGPLIGVAECLNAQLEFHAQGVVQVSNPRDQDTHEDADYRKTVVDWGHGAASPYAIASTGGCVVYVNSDGVFARSLGLQNVRLSRAIYDAGRPAGSRGVLEYALLGDSTHVASCAAADSGGDTFKVALSIISGVVHLRYFSANTVTYFDREIRYDFSRSLGRDGLAEVLQDDGTPYPWSAPLTLRASTSCLLTKADGVHHFAAFDSNAGTGDGRVDEVDTGVYDNGAAIAPVGYQGPARPPELNRARPLKVRALSKKVLTATGLTVAVARDPEKAPASSTWDAVTLGPSGTDDYERSMLALPETVRYAKEMIAVRISDTGAADSISDFPELSQLEIEYEPEESVI